MSLPTFPFPPEQLTRDDAINLILSSIAMEEVGLSHIINAEGEKLQYMLGTLSGMTGPMGTVDQVLQANESVQKMLQAASYNQMFLSAKMENALAASQLNQSPASGTVINFPNAYSGGQLVLMATEADNAALLLGNNTAVPMLGPIIDPLVVPLSPQRTYPINIATAGSITSWSAQFNVSLGGAGTMSGAIPTVAATLWYAPPLTGSPVNLDNLVWTLAGTIDFGPLNSGGYDSYVGSQTLSAPFPVAVGGSLYVRFNLVAGDGTLGEARASIASASASVIIG